MAGYSPLKITGNSTGLVQEREEFLLPDDAYPVLQNAYVWREKIKRKRGYQLLGRLQRNLVAVSIGNFSSAGAGTITINLFTSLGLLATQPDASFVPGTATTPLVITIGAPISQTLTDNTGTGTFTIAPAGVITAASINYATGVLTLTYSGVVAASAATITAGYYPNLPVMGIRIREQQNSANDQTVVFNQIYAFVFDSGTNQYKEFIPGTTWNAHAATVSGTDFFWSTNYWVSSLIITNPPAFSTQFTTTNRKLFWVTNNTGQFGALADPPRITDGTTWVDFYHDTAPAINSPWAQIDATNFLTNWLCMLPFRGRMVTFNTWEGPTATSSLNYSNRIRWSRIGNPFIPYDNGPPTRGSWRDDVRGQGGFLDIPTSEDIIAIGFVRDNLVIYCERSTWQLRYTGRAIAPFQIEMVNSELGAESTFSAVQFDTSLLGIGDKGVVECDSYKSERIDIKIPDLVFQFQSLHEGVTRVHGIRDFINRLAYWTFPDAAANSIFPTQRLVYNYENDSWALFNDSLTTLGTFQPTSSRTWLNTHLPWIKCNFNWINQPAEDPTIIGGNQQGFVEYLDELTTNDVSLYILNITANTTTPTVITSPNHNMKTGFVIGISGIPIGTPFDNLNGGIFGIIVIDANNFRLMLYNTISQQFSNPQLDVPTTPFVGVGYINIRENFTITSKKFNYLDEGQNIQLGYIDILMAATESTNPGAIALNVYLDYDDVNASNTLPQNDINDGSALGNPDLFFNSIIPTTQSSLSNIRGTKFWQRVYCATRASFLTLQYTFNNAQMAGKEQEQDVQIDAQILWIRKAGRMSSL